MTLMAPNFISGGKASVREHVDEGFLVVNDPHTALGTDTDFSFLSPWVSRSAEMFTLWIICKIFTAVNDFPHQ